MKKIWRWDYNLIRRVYEALFCAKKNGDTIKTFSTKKCASTLAVTLALMNHLDLHLDPSNHWVVALKEQGVSDMVTTALIVSLDGMAATFKAVYMIGKAKNAA